MTGPVRFAIIGLGVVGVRHVRTFGKSGGKDFVLSAAVEVNPTTARAARPCLPPHVPIYSSMDDLLAGSATLRPKSYELGPAFSEQ